MSLLVALLALAAAFVTGFVLAALIRSGIAPLCPRCARQGATLDTHEGQHD